MTDEGHIDKKKSAANICTGAAWLWCAGAPLWSKRSSVPLQINSHGTAQMNKLHLWGKEEKEEGGKNRHKHHRGIMTVSEVYVITNMGELGEGGRLRSAYRIAGRNKRIQMKRTPVLPALILVYPFYLGTHRQSDHYGTAEWWREAMRMIFP